LKLEHTTPYFPDVGVIAIVPDVWGGPWQPRHQILTRLAAYFHVVWVNPAMPWRETWLPKQVANEDVNGKESTLTGFTIYWPERWLPAFYWPHFLARFTAQERLRRAYRMLCQKGCQRVILYVWRPEHGAALDLVKADLSCYHIDDEYTFSDIEQPISKYERQLISHVDQVFIHSPGLMEKKGGLNPNTKFIPNGVDYDAYVQPWREPVDLARVPRPRIGYVGLIKKQLDWPLLNTLAQRHSDWSFVFVGPYWQLGNHAVLVENIAQYSNVYFLGRKPVEELPAYTQHLDVCMLCYEMNDYTKFIYPLKLHEYLAAGRSVVGTPIRSLQKFDRVIKLARSTEEWSTALAESLAPDMYSVSRTEERRRVAHTHDWKILVSRIARTLCERLGPSYLSRFQKMGKPLLSP